MSQPLKGAERQRVVVALSGGVDSATAAALLVEQGHEVIGLTLRLYDAGGTAHSSGGRCCGPRDLEDARRVAGHLGIPFYVVDHQELLRHARTRIPAYALPRRISILDDLPRTSSGKVDLTRLAEFRGDSTPFKSASR